jgi:hypothetical protein
MSKKNLKRLIVLGVIVCLCVAAAVGYSLAFNEGRLVYLMDFRSYQFNINDVPMIVAAILVILYVVYLCGSLMVYSLVNRRDSSKKGRARKISPKFGYLGFFGFVGFLGIWTYLMNGMIFPFVFFIFFGFFGFFYEGKMSNVLADERFRRNRREAELKALRIGYRLNFILLLLVGITGSRAGTGIIAALLTAGMSLIYALVMFLSEYLLYRYDQMDARDWKDEE